MLDTACQCRGEEISDYDRLSSFMSVNRKIEAATIVGLYFEIKTIL